MQSARCSARSMISATTNPGASTMSCAPLAAIASRTCGRSGPSPNMTPRRPGIRSAAITTAGTTAGARFSGM